MGFDSSVNTWESTEFFDDSDMGRVNHFLQHHPRYVFSQVFVVISMNVCVCVCAHHVYVVVCVVTSLFICFVSFCYGLLYSSLAQTNKTC